MSSQGISVIGFSFIECKYSHLDIKPFSIFSERNLVTYHCRRYLLWFPFSPGLLISGDRDQGFPRCWQWWILCWIPDDAAGNSLDACRWRHRGIWRSPAMCQFCNCFLPILLHYRECFKYCCILIECIIILTTVSHPKLVAIHVSINGYPGCGRSVRTLYMLGW